MPAVMQSLCPGIRGRSREEVYENPFTG